MRKYIRLYLIVLAARLLAGCDWLVPAGEITAPVAYVVRHDVTGTISRADIRYLNVLAKTVEVVSEPIPWSNTWTTTGDCELYLSATSCDPAGSITVTISVDGVLLESEENAGAFVTATAYGSVD